MAWCFSTRASVATVLTTHPCVSRCLRVNSLGHERCGANWWYPIDGKSTLVLKVAWCLQHQAIIWANADPDLCHHMASLCHIELRAVVTSDWAWPGDADGKKLCSSGVQLAGDIMHAELDPQWGIRSANTGTGWKLTNFTHGGPNKKTVILQMQLEMRFHEWFFLNSNFTKVCSGRSIWPILNQCWL